MLHGVASATFSTNHHDKYPIYSCVYPIPQRNTLLCSETSLTPRCTKALPFHNLLTSNTSTATLYIPFIPLLPPFTLVLMRMTYPPSMLTFCLRITSRYVLHPFDASNEFSQLFIATLSTSQSRHQLSSSKHSRRLSVSISSFRP